MIQFLFETPICGSYTMLILVVTCIVYMLVSYRQSVKKFDTKLFRNERKTKNKDCCSKKVRMTQKIVDIFTTPQFAEGILVKHLVNDVKQTLEAKGFECNIKNLSECTEKSSAGASLVIIEEQESKSLHDCCDPFKKWLLRQQSVPFNFKFYAIVVFDYSGILKIMASEWDKSVYSLGGHSLCKTECIAASNSDEVIRKCAHWKEELLRALIRRSSKPNCLCKPKNGSTSCDSDSDNETCASAKLRDVEDLALPL